VAVLADDELLSIEAVFVRPVPFFREEAPPLSSKRVLLLTPSRPTSFVRCVVLDKDDTDAGGVGECCCVADRSPNFRRRCGNCNDGLAAASSTVTIISNVVTTATIDIAGNILILFISIIVKKMVGIDTWKH
jgi:hypothetical protein